MFQISKHSVSKALVSIAIEQSLVKVGPTVLDLVSCKIYEKYRCYVPDCYDNPEYLNTVIDDMPGPMRQRIVNLIRNQLSEFAYQKEIQKFLEKLGRGLHMDSNMILTQ